MSCNKDEAVRAMEIAEKKMEIKDFIGARKLALRAQQLNPDGENISQMLMVCDVHCAAEKKLSGNEMDWYGILQIEQTANEATIRKQYRKYALLLHPDKNKFMGAEAAFKLVGEAQRILLDQEKRQLHDMRRKLTVSHRAPHKAASTFDVGVQANFRNNFTRFIPQHQPPQQHGHSGFGHNHATFWTVCPFCSVRYHYYKEVVNRSLCCQNCKNPFVAYDMELQGSHSQPTYNFNQSSFFQKKNFFSHRAETGRPRNSRSEKYRAESFQRTRKTSGGAVGKFNTKKKRKQSSESSDSCDTGSSSESEENVITDEVSRKDVGRTGEHRPRRSSRHKQKISYSENISDDDDDFEITPKKSSRRVPSDTSDDDIEEVYVDDRSVDVDNDQRETNEPENSRTEGSSSRRSTRSKKASEKETADKNVPQRRMKSAGDPEPKLLERHDPDFNDFDKLRNRDCFSPGQIWAMYRDIDTMPRFYARINRAFPSEFKIQVTWLEPEATDKKMPISCGDFVFGATETMTDCGSMFSHAVSWDKGGRKDSFKIFPRRGETWALFKNWDKNSQCDSNSKAEYEFVETLSEYTEEAGIDVALLAKVKGFSSLFGQMVDQEGKSFRIPADELFRFSHRIPSFPLTGDEREDVPKGSFELDPAALPPNIPEIAIPEHLKEMAGDTGHDTLKPTRRPKCREATADVKSDLSSESNDDCAHVASSGEAYEIPDPEFHNFDVDKSFDKFKINQVWALYSDEDALPRYYGLIRKITREPKFEVKLMWLEPSALPSDAIEWDDKDMLISCGKFRPQRRTSMHCCNSTGSFSHLVKTNSSSKNEISISPRNGEVWALYKNWTPEFRCSDLDKRVYDIAEVIDEDDLQKEVMVLERVDGYNSVFKARAKNDGSMLTMVITQAELLRFSHQIPAFRLTDERGGSLRGCLELDPAALPVYFFS